MGDFSVVAGRIGRVLRDSSAKSLYSKDFGFAPGVEVTIMYKQYHNRSILSLVFRGSVYSQGITDVRGGASATSCDATGYLCTGAETRTQVNSPPLT